MPHGLPAYQRRLPDRVYSPDWLRRAEPDAAQQTGTTLYALMQRAGEAAYQHARRCYPNARRWLVLCGQGNNGGDGYVVATLARAAGVETTVVACNAAHPLPEEAQCAYAEWQTLGDVALAPDSPWPDGIDLIIDGLLGTGLSSAPRAPYDALIARANAHAAPVLALVQEKRSSLPVPSPLLRSNRDC